MPLFTTWSKKVRTFRIESFWDVFIWLDPLIGIVVHLVHIDNQEVTWQDSDTINVYILTHIHETREQNGWLESESLIEYLRKILKVLDFVIAQVVHDVDRESLTPKDFIMKLSHELLPDLVFPG